MKKYGFEGKAIVTMEEVTEYLYNKEHNGKVVIDDKIKLQSTITISSMDVTNNDRHRKVAVGIFVLYIILSL